jgi:hypothetical protein
MENDETTRGDQRQPIEPAAALRSLNRLVGTWTVSGPGGLGGQVTYTWMEGGGFLVQSVDLVQGGERNTGVEYIGYDEASGTLRSHYFGGSGGILEYTYDLDGDTLTIWHPAPGSPAYFRGTFSADGKSNAGRWVWPGGGYESNMTRAGG